MPQTRKSATSSDATLRFLQQFQELLQHSDFTMSYKFALLKAICDLAIELPEGSRTIDLDAVADRFVAIYWEQSKRFRGIDLNHGGSEARPSRAISLAKQWRSDFGNKYWRLQQADHIIAARRDMRTLIRKDVLWRLQPSGQRPFIYRNKPRGNEIELMPGAARAMRLLHMLLSDLIESQWTRWIQRRNPTVISEASLREHLFGADRRRLKRVVPRLLELQHERSFYSKRELTTGQIHVDHFIPWSISRHDAIGNLVLCTASENIAFSDSLKPAEMRQRWSTRNTEHADQLRSIARETGFRWDPEATNAIADWAYRAAI